MKTALFFFYLNSLGMVLILTQARQPPLTGVGCKLTRAGHEYNGLLSVTRSGRTCQRWNCDQPHKNHYKKSKLFPEGSAGAAGNRCRNPDKDYYEGVWCYTTDPKKRWEECDVDFCLQTRRVPPSSTRPKTTATSPTSPKTTATPSPTSPETTLPSHTSSETTLPPHTSSETTLPSPTSPETTLLSHTSSKTTPESTKKNLTTIRPRTTPDTTSPPSTNVATGSITQSLPLPQTNGSRDDASFTNIVVFGIPIVGMIAVICVIVVVIIIIWRRTALFQSPWRSFDHEGIPPRSKRNQQKNMAAKAMYKPSDCCENPDDVNCQLHSEMPL